MNFRKKYDLGRPSDFFSERELQTCRYPIAPYDIRIDQECWLRSPSPEKKDLLKDDFP